jgi:hypothetical protein
MSDYRSFDEAFSEYRSFTETVESLHGQIQFLVAKPPPKFWQWQNLGSDSLVGQTIDQFPSTLLSYNLSPTNTRVVVEKLRTLGYDEFLKYDASLGGSRYAVRPRRPESGTVAFQQPFGDQVHALLPLRIGNIQPSQGVQTVNMAPGDGGLFVTATGDLLTADNVRFLPIDCWQDWPKVEHPLGLDSAQRYGSNWGGPPTENFLVVQLREVSLRNEPGIVPRVQEALGRMSGQIQAANDWLRPAAAAIKPPTQGPKLPKQSH